MVAYNSVSEMSINIETIFLGFDFRKWGLLTV